MERLTALVSGKVQMVMYRDFAARNARALNLIGEVRNLQDGRVAVTAEGPRANLEALVAKLRKGPWLARVDAVDASWSPATGEYSGFSITYE